MGLNNFPRKHFSTLLFPGPVAHIFTIISSFTKQETSNQVNTGNIYRHLQLSTVMSLRSLHHLVLPGHDPLGGGEESSKAFPLNASSSSLTFPLGSRKKLCRMQAAIASVDTFSGSRLILRWKNLSSTGMPEYQKHSQPPQPRSWESWKSSFCGWDSVQGRVSRCFPSSAPRPFGKFHFSQKPGCPIR